MKSSFQTILVVVCLAAFVIAVLVFSGILGGKNAGKSANTPQGRVVVWGTVPTEQVNTLFDAFNISNKGYSISYSEHSPENFRQDLIEALAGGVSPDVVLLSSELFSQIKDKLYVTPFTAYSERTFRDTNIDGAQLFLSADGIIAFPVVVDPLVVYYNRDILAGANFVVPPSLWDTLVASVPLLTKRDAKGALIQSATGLGTYQNVLHARDILSALFLQTGNSIVGYDAGTKTFVSVLSRSTTDSDFSPVAEALSFYTSFADPTSSNYSWNSALPNTRAQFVAGKSAMYIGRASELFTIQSQNPNLSFDVAQLFQSKSATRPVTFGSFTGVAMLKSSLNPVAAYAAVQYLSSSAMVDTFSKTLSLPPVRRDLLLVAPPSPYMAVFFKAALASFSWPDPNQATTEQIFRDMITNVTSGKRTAVQAIYEANQNIQSNIR